MFSKNIIKRLDDAALIIKYYKTWFDGVVINDVQVSDVDPLATREALLNCSVENYRRILLNAVQDAYDKTHNRSYPKSNRLYLDGDRKVKIAGLTWEDFIEISGIQLNVKNHIYVLNDKNQLNLLYPQMLPIRFESRPSIPYEQCVQQKRAGVQQAQSSWLGALSAVFSSELPKKVEPPKRKEITYLITAQIASSLYLYANDTALLNDEEKQLPSHDGALLRVILNKISLSLGKGDVDSVKPLKAPGFRATIDETVWNSVIAIDKQQRAIFDELLSELINAYIQDSASFSSILSPQSFVKNTIVN